MKVIRTGLGFLFFPIVAVVSLSFSFFHAHFGRFLSILNIPIWLSFIYIQPYTAYSSDHCSCLFYLVITLFYAIQPFFYASSVKLMIFFIDFQKACGMPNETLIYIHISDIR